MTSQGATVRVHDEPPGGMPLEITLSAHHMDISPALRAAADEKIGRLSRFLGGMDRAEVHFSEERNPRIVAKEVCEVTMEGQGHHVRCKVAAADAFAAVDLAVEKLEQQLHKVKTKQVQRTHAARRAVPVDVVVDEERGGLVEPL